MEDVRARRLRALGRRDADRRLTRRVTPTCWCTTRRFSRRPNGASRFTPRSEEVFDVARAAAVRALVLNHLSIRYDAPTRYATLREQLAASGFARRLLAARRERRSSI